MLTRKGYFVFGIPTAIILFMGLIGTIIPDQPDAPLKAFVFSEFIHNCAAAFSSLAVIGLWLLAYFLPAITASYRKHQNKAAIIGLNILLGWTVLGWIVAFIWSLTATAESISQSAPCPSSTDVKQPG